MARFFSTALRWSRAASSRAKYSSSVSLGFFMAAPSVGRRLGDGRRLVGELVRRGRRRLLLRLRRGPRLGRGGLRLRLGRFRLRRLRLRPALVEELARHPRLPAARVVLEVAAVVLGRLVLLSLVAVRL